MLVSGSMGNIVYDRLLNPIDLYKQVGCNNHNYKWLVCVKNF